MGHQMPQPERILSHALVRPPGASFAAALSSRGGPINVALAQAQHAEYRQALVAAGLTVEVLPADERYPDSCFMQDPAVVIGGRAVIGRPGAPSRRGEEETIAGYLATRLPLARLVPPATLEGGDVMILPDRVLVGRSGRTNRAGIAQLAVAIAESGLAVIELPLEAGLHLLSFATYLGRGMLLAAEPYGRHPVFAGLEIITVPPEEAAAANALAIRETVILSAGYPRVTAMLAERGFAVLPVPTSEFAQADGGVTCLSLVW